MEVGHFEPASPKGDVPYKLLVEPGMKPIKNIGLPAIFVETRTSYVEDKSDNSDERIPLLYPEDDGITVEDLRIRVLRSSAAKKKPKTVKKSNSVGLPAVNSTSISRTYVEPKETRNPYLADFPLPHIELNSRFNLSWGGCSKNKNRSMPTGRSSRPSDNFK